MLQRLDASACSQSSPGHPLQSKKNLKSVPRARRRWRRRPRSASSWWRRPASARSPAAWLRPTRTSSRSAATTAARAPRPSRPSSTAAGRSRWASPRRTRRASSGSVSIAGWLPAEFLWVSAGPGYNAVVGLYVVVLAEGARGCETATGGQRPPAPARGHTAPPPPHRTLHTCAGHAAPLSPPHAPPTIALTPRAGVGRAGPLIN